jgi:hypothetical protein
LNGWLGQHLLDSVSQMEARKFCCRFVRFTRSLKGRMCTLVSVFAKTLQITALMMIEELQFIRAGFDDTPLKLQRVFYTLIVTCINLINIALIFSIESLGDGVTSDSKITYLVD